MSVIADRARERHSTIRANLSTRFPYLVPRHQVTPAITYDPSAIVLGRNERGEPLSLPLKARLEHTQVIGTTGGGKTRLLQHCIQQDIADGRGVCVVDPHGNHPGSLYRSLLQWLDQRGYTKSRTIHLIDPNAGTHVTGIDPLALPTPGYDFAVVAEAMQEALEKAWGEEDMDTKPTMQRVLAATLSALAELKLTLAQARFLFDATDRHGIRAWAIAQLTEPDTQEELQWLQDIAAGTRGAQEFRLEVTGPRNRLAKLTRSPAIRAMVGQQARVIDFRAALDEGHIILANLSPGPCMSDKAAQLIGRLLTRMLFFHCQRRTRPEIPFFFYLDECQLYLSGDVSRFLAESRKYGLGVVLASQFLAQYDAAGSDIREAVKNATNIKIVFRIKDAEEAVTLADLVIPYDLEVPVGALVKPTVVGHHRVQLHSTSAAEQHAITNAVSKSEGTSATQSYSVTNSISEGESEGTSFGESMSASAAETSSHGFTVGESEGMATALAFGGNNLSQPQGMTISGSRDRQVAQSFSHGATSGQSSTQSSGRSSSRSRSTSSSVSEGIAVTQSHATAVSRGETRGTTQTHGSAEAFEPFYEERPSAVHSLDNIRYRAAQALRNLTAGKAAVSFVDRAGMKTAALSVAHVEDAVASDALLARIRHDIFAASPSAQPYEEAVRILAERDEALKDLARHASEPEPACPASFRNKKVRVKKQNGSAAIHEVQ